MPTPTVFNWMNDFVNGFFGQRPIYVNGVEIGYWTAEKSDLCQGKAFIYPEFQDEYNHGFYPPETWVTKDDLWRDVPVSQYCLSKNIAPSWATTSGTTVTVPAAVAGGAPTSYTVNPDQSITMPGSNSPLSAIGKLLPSNVLGIPIGIALVGGAVAALVFLHKDNE
jgi:hypothetical protein